MRYLSIDMLLFKLFHFIQSFCLIFQFLWALKRYTRIRLKNEFSHDFLENIGEKKNVFDFFIGYSKIHCKISYFFILACFCEILTIKPCSWRDKDYTYQPVESCIYDLTNQHWNIFVGWRKQDQSYQKFQLMP